MNKKLVVFLGIGCGGLLLLLVVAGIFVASSIPKMIEWGSEQIALEQERQQLANNWRPPEDDAPSGAIFPTQVDDYKLVSHDQDAAIPDLRFDLSGSHAVYESNGSRIDVYAYQVNGLEKEALFKRVHDLHDNDHGTGVKHITTLEYRCFFSSPRHHQNHLWWMKDWLLVFRTRDAEDREPFVKSFLQATPNSEDRQSPRRAGAVMPPIRMSDSRNGALSFGNLFNERNVRFVFGTDRVLVAFIGAMTGPARPAAPRRAGVVTPGYAPVPLPGMGSGPIVALSGSAECLWISNIAGKSWPAAVCCDFNSSHYPR